MRTPSGTDARPRVANYASGLRFLGRRLSRIIAQPPADDFSHLAEKAAEMIDPDARPDEPSLRAAQNSISHQPLSRGAAWNAGWNAFSTLWTIAVSFVIAPLLIDKLGTNQYGVLLLIWSVTGLLGLAGLGFGEATLRYIAHYFGQGSLGDVNRVMGSTLTFFLVICAAVLTAVLVAAPHMASWFKLPTGSQAEFSWLLRLAGAVFVLRTITLTYASIPMALQRYDINGKIAVLLSIVRSGGYIALALAGFGLVELVLWDAVTQAGALVAHALAIRFLAPGVTLLPSLSLSGLSEISGFSVFSFLTLVFHMMQRESGKLALGWALGPAPVAYLGTPDNVALRIHSVVASGSEILMPRFSANRDSELARSLFRAATWTSLVISLVCLVPLIVLLPDFLGLWVSPDFARESATVGQLVAFSYISQGAYTSAATFFRGTGQPWRVTLVILVAGLTTLAATVLLIPKYGLSGVGYAYVLASLPAMYGTVDGWYRICGASSTRGLARIIGLPLAMAGVAFCIAVVVRGWLGEVGWSRLIFLGVTFALSTSGLIVLADLALGGTDAPSRPLLHKLANSIRLRLHPLRATR